MLSGSLNFSLVCGVVEICSVKAESVQAPQRVLLICAFAMATWAISHQTVFILFNKMFKVF